MCVKMIRRVNDEEGIKVRLTSINISLLLKSETMLMPLPAFP